MLRRIVGLTAGLAVSAVAGYQLAYKPWRRQWAANPGEATMPLPGDELVSAPDFDETLAQTIEAPPSAVWPWLLQMGYGRAGWYSYDSIDMLGHSSRAIVPELQQLELGQAIPLAPSLAFRVDVLEPERALVLYGDSELAAQDRRTQESPGTEPAEEEPRGLRLVGGLADANMSEFAVSWAFVLEPLHGGRTRLLERFRTRTTPGPAAALVGPLIDHGHFLMTRKQMLGIKDRAEKLARELLPARPAEAAAAAS